MSTKSMSRSIREGGHGGKRSNLIVELKRRERRQIKRWLRDCNDQVFVPQRLSATFGYEAVRRSGHSCRVVTKFLWKNLGQPWDKVWSKLCSRFTPEARELCGLRNKVVTMSGSLYFDFFVDQAGLLRHSDEFEWEPRVFRDAFDRNPETWKSITKVVFIKGEPWWCQRFGIYSEENFDAWKLLQPLTNEEMDYLFRISGRAYQDLVLRGQARRRVVRES